MCVWNVCVSVCLCESVWSVFVCGVCVCVCVCVFGRGGCSTVGHYRHLNI